MRKGILHLFLSLFFIMVLFSGVNSTWATILTFDDLSGSSFPIPNGYGGLTWSQNFWQLDGSDPSYADSGYDHGRVSGNHVAYNALENVVLVSDGLFDFNGAYLTGAWKDDLNLQVRGYSGVSLLYDQTVFLNTTAPTWFAFNYAGIDQLQFSSFGGTHNPQLLGDGRHFVMDNFTFNEPIITPEPTTIFLLGSAFLGLAGIRRKLGK